MMKKNLQISCVGLIMLLVMYSCTVERRLHNSGFHVKWNKIYNSSSEDSEIAENIVQESSIESVRSEVKSVQSISDNENNSEFSEEVRDNSEIAEIKNNQLNKAENSSEVKSEKTAALKSNLIKKSIKQTLKSEKQDDTEMILLVILCFILPPIAVGLKTDWDTKKVLINVVLTLLCGIPGVIHALLVVLDEI